MHCQKILFVCLILICVFVLSCQKLEQAPPTSTLKFEQIKLLDAIPIEFGNLIAITTSPEYPGWAQLWFQKQDKTIVVVKVQWGKGYLNQEATIIPRR